MRHIQLQACRSRIASKLSISSENVRTTTKCIKLLLCGTLHDYKLILVAQEQACPVVGTEVPEMLK